MKQTYILLTTLIFILNGNILNAQITFDWEDDSVTDNGNNVTEELFDIIATFTGSTDEVTFDNIGDILGTSGNIVMSSEVCNTENSVAFSFNQAVDVVSILAIICQEENIDFTFTPTGGSNSVVVAPLVNSSAQVNLNWTNVTSFIVSTTTPITFAFDNLVIQDPTLSTNNFTVKTVKISPNPSSNFIEITGLTTTENYNIYNTLGQEVKKGIANNNEKIDIQNLTPGIYFLKFETGNTLKFIKE